MNSIHTSTLTLLQHSVVCIPIVQCFLKQYSTMLSMSFRAHQAFLQDLDGVGDEVVDRHGKFFLLVVKAEASDDATSPASS